MSLKRSRSIYTSAAAALEPLFKKACREAVGAARAARVDKISKLEAQGKQTEVAGFLVLLPGEAPRVVAGDSARSVAVKVLPGVTDNHVIWEDNRDSSHCQFAAYICEDECITKPTPCSEFLYELNIRFVSTPTAAVIGDFNGNRLSARALRKLKTLYLRTERDIARSDAHMLREEEADEGLDEIEYPSDSLDESLSSFSSVSDDGDFP